jgi:radical SAM protein with 4Fe4S-binding SPASM domain
MRDFFTRVVQAGVPVSGGFDLTSRCNFRCRHCYLGHLTGQARREAAELTTGQVVDLMSQAVDVGCLLLLLTGGEPLLRDDFLDIYVAARRMGLLVTVFTNGSLVSKRHLDVFAEYPPHEVEISLYGMSEDTYERVTGVRAFGRVMESVDNLVDRHVRIGLKSMILRENAADIGSMESYARSLGVPFRVDPVVTPRLDGDRGPLAQRVDPEAAAALEMQVEGYREDMARFYDEHSASIELDQPLSKKLYRCGAGRESFHVDSRGFVHPCEMSPIAYDSRQLGLARCWDAVRAAVNEAVWEEADKCAGCSHVLLCGYCPALFALEGASPAQPPSYLCALGENRRAAIEREELEVVGVNPQ